jgi:putative toxin-antitoxin system antitoxin component (TIGR02293 family)
MSSNEEALRLAHIAELARRVFGDAGKADRWLRKPKCELNGATPRAYLSSESGARTVEQMLHRIDHGMAA